MVACTVFTAGCNFRCPFCHNAQLVVTPHAAQMPEEEFFAFLQKRSGVLDGVCITGGEPTLQAGLGTFIKKIRALGYKVKLDTNGAKPECLERLLGEGLLDYAAMDIKNARERYAVTAGVPVDIALPLFNRNQGNIRRAQINVVQTQLELENLARRVVTDVQVAEREYKVSRAALEHIDMNLRPAAEQVLSTVKRQYDEGSIDVIAFISARQEYNQVVRQYLDTLIRYRQSMYALNTAVGQRIFP